MRPEPLRGISCAGRKWLYYGTHVRMIRVFGVALKQNAMTILIILYNIDSIEQAILMQRPCGKTSR